MFTHSFVTAFGFCPYYGLRTALYKAMDACLTSLVLSSYVSVCVLCVYVAVGRRKVV